MLKWVFGADTGPYRTALNKMRDDTKAFAGDVRTTLAGMFSAAALTSWISATLEAAGRIDDLSKRLDMSAESFQRLSYASKLSGGDMEVVGKSLTILTKNLAEASREEGKFADEAAVLGLNLEQLAAMSPEDQMVELARGYSQSADKGAALAAIMKLLGKSGAEVVPMLSEGPEALRDLFDEASVATDKQIATMAALGDAWDSLKSKSVAALGDIIDGFKIAAASAEFFLNTILGNDNASEQLDRRFDQIRGLDKAQKRTGPAGDPQESAKEQAKRAKDRQKLEEDIAKLEEDARQRGLSLAEKIADAEERRADAAADATFVENDQERLVAQKKMLEIEKELADLRKQQVDEQKRADDERKRHIEELASALEAEERAERDNRLAGMTDAERIKALEGERDAARTAASKAAQAGDSIGATEKRTEATQLQGEIDAMRRSLADDARSKLDELRNQSPTIAASSLAEVGGGGGVRMLMSQQDIARESRDYLAIIAENTRSIPGAPTSTPEPP